MSNHSVVENSKIFLKFVPSILQNFVFMGNFEILAQWALIKDARQIDVLKFELKKCFALIKSFENEKFMIELFLSINLTKFA